MTHGPEARPQQSTFSLLQTWAMKKVEWLATLSCLFSSSNNPTASYMTSPTVASTAYCYILAIFMYSPSRYPKHTRHLTSRDTAFHSLFLQPPSHCLGGIGLPRVQPLCHRHLAAPAARPSRCRCQQIGSCCQYRSAEQSPKGGAAIEPED